MVKKLHTYKIVKKLLSPILSTKMVSERREVGVQVADFAERKQKEEQKEQRQKEKQRNKELIKNQPWLG